MREISETSASDGDIFPAMFREAGLGPLIGKRSWGGVIGISGRGPLIDGGQDVCDRYFLRRSRQAITAAAPLPISSAG